MTVMPRKPQSERITFESPKHGLFSASEYLVDLMMLRHLPASPQQLRALVEEQVGDGLNYSDVHGVASFLIILASFAEGRVNNGMEA